MSRVPAPIFVDTGAWIALALTKDTHHAEATAIWQGVSSSGAKLLTSIPVVLETFTFLERNTRLDVAQLWRRSLDDVRRLRVLECTRADLAASWKWFERRELHRLSAVDATSFAIMQREGLRVAFSFDRHFSLAGFRLAG